VINDISRRDSLRRFINILTAVIFTAIFSSSPVFSAEVAESTDKLITGILVKVDEKNLAIYVKENSRIVKFKASSVLCAEFKDKINAEVDITYNIGINKSLQIITMVTAVKKVEPVKTPFKSKASLKSKTKK